MNVLLYWHDIYLPYSVYMIQAFDRCNRISKLTVVGPEVTVTDSIFLNGVSDYSNLKKTEMIKIKTYSLRKKWGKFTEYYRIIKQFKPDLIIILDEALYLNVFNAGLSNYLLRNNAKVFFYGFENIDPAIPWKYLKQNFSNRNS